MSKHNQDGDKPLERVRREDAAVRVFVEQLGTAYSPGILSLIAHIWRSTHGE